MEKNYVNLDVNPCKMCMPMGMATVLKGIKNCMTILHGSQGCSTYIRRHMATHYNEPIDIASSSLTEEGTVYGGENNLKTALLNVIKLYSPEVIGIGTTCLAETIGEDIDRIIKEVKDIEPYNKVRMITASTAGYKGTQFEGYHVAMRSIIQQLADNPVKNKKLNILVPHLTPADIRYIKEVLNDFNADYTLFPDFSETLDSGYSKEYKRIPEGGTDAKDIANMGGAKASIQLGVTVPHELSAGHYLLERFRVPLFQIPVPIGVKNTDRFIKLLSQLTGNPIPVKYKKARARALDAMIDSHKYNAQGKATLFGEPELVYSLASLCIENGIKPEVLAIGGKNVLFKKLLAPLVVKEGYNPLFLSEADFETIQQQTIIRNSNILIGSSDGKWIEEREGIPLIRVGFPVHDRIGAQRRLNVCYEGTLRLLDEITNCLIEHKHDGYRKEMYESFYKKQVCSQ